MVALLLYWLTKILIVLFLFGLFGSAVVVLITFFEDGLLLLESDERSSKPQKDDVESPVAQRREAF